MRLCPQRPRSRLARYRRSSALWPLSGAKYACWLRLPPSRLGRVHAGMNSAEACRRLPVGEGLQPGQVAMQINGPFQRIVVAMLPLKDRMERLFDHLSVSRRRIRRAGNPYRHDAQCSAMFIAEQFVRDHRMYGHDRTCVDRQRALLANALDDGYEGVVQVLEHDRIFILFGRGDVVFEQRFRFHIRVCVPFDLSRIETPYHGQIAQFSGREFRKTAPPAFPDNVRLLPVGLIEYRAGPVLVLVHISSLIEQN